MQNKIKLSSHFISHMLVATFFAVLLLSLVGCQSTPPQTQKDECGAWIFAIPFASEADKAYYNQAQRKNQEAIIKSCLQSTYQNGFTTPTIGRESTSQLPAATELTSNFRILRSQQGAQITLSSGWQVSDSPSTIYQFFAKHPTRNAALAISVYEQNPLITWSDTRDALFQRITERLIEVRKEKFVELNIGGSDAFSIEYSGLDERSKAPLQFWGTHYRIGNKNVYLTLWCLEQDYPNLKSEFKQIRDTLILSDYAR